MAKVYIVFRGEYSDRRTEGVFSTREKAEAFAAELGWVPADEDCECDIEEWELDGREGEVMTDVWTVYIDLEKGGITGRDEPRREMWRPSRGCGVETCRDLVGEVVAVVSPVSREHAVKVAVERRQAWLRERDLSGAGPK